MRPQNLLRSTLCVALVLAACSKKTETAAAAPGAPTTSPTAAPAAAGGIGIKECDDYLRSYRACVDSKIPDASRASVRQMIDTAEAEWRRAMTTVSSDAQRAAVAEGCRNASTAARATWSAVGCTF
jgi:hypothetical protein